MTREAELHATVHVEAASLVEAHNAAADVIAFLSRYGAVQESCVTSYPKFDHHYAVRLAMEAANPEDLIAAVVQVVGGSWHDQRIDDDISAIWDLRNGGTPPVAAMRWIHLQLVTPNTTTALLGDDEALLLFESLSRWRENEQLMIADQAERWSYSALLCALEKTLEAPLMADYRAQLAAARARLTR